ncbi:MAG: hypothetical protein ABFQ62_04680 [Patescibacteria group bacterium]
MNKKTKKILNEEELIQEDMKLLAIERLKSIPSNYQISVGGDGSFSRDEAIENVKNDSEIGKELIDVQIEFLRDMAQGELYKYE